MAASGSFLIDISATGYMPEGNDVVQKPKPTNICDIYSQKTSRKEAELSDLIGATLLSIHVGSRNDEILFTTNSGKMYLMYHCQDCCERVEINDIEGDFNDLIGSPILQAEENHNREDTFGKIECPDSFTWTFYKFATMKGYVTIRWLGESNGYYSESVDFSELYND